MSAIEFANQLKSEIEAFAAQGEDSVKVDVLLSGLEKFIKNPQEESEQILVERLKAHFQSNLEIEKHNHSAEIEMFKSLIQTGQSSCKTLILLNGGAAIALLAFVGKLADVSRTNIPLFAWPLTVFVIGAFLATIVSGLTYLTQLSYSEEGTWRQRIGKTLHLKSILLGLMALITFGYGTYLSYNAFIALGG